MSKIQRIAVIASLSMASLSTVREAQAQFVRRGLGGGLVIRAPYAPPVALNVRGAIAPIPLVRPYLFPRRAVVVVPTYGVAPTVAPGPYRPARDVAPFYTPDLAVTAAPMRGGWPTARELARLDDVSLLNATLAAAAQLDIDVGQFRTGATWRSYFALPSDALPQPSADGQVRLSMPSIFQTLERFESVAANPEFATVSALTSFTATQEALQEVARRFGNANVRNEPPARSTVSQPPAEPSPMQRAPALAASAQPVDTEPAASEPAVTQPVVTESASEELPTPPPALIPPAQAADGERSVLRQ